MKSEFKEEEAYINDFVKARCAEFNSWSSVIYELRPKYRRYLLANPDFEAKARRRWYNQRKQRANPRRSRKRAKEVTESATQTDDKAATIEEFKEKYSLNKH